MSSDISVDVSPDSLHKSAQDLKSLYLSVEVSHQTDPRRAWGASNFSMTGLRKPPSYFLRMSSQYIPMMIIGPIRGEHGKKAYYQRPSK
jgi:hypothetical protein